jgi:Caprin-1 dimerization domain
MVEIFIARANKKLCKSNLCNDVHLFQNKLDGYIKEEESGKELSSEQKKAVEKYDEVVNQLGISKEYLKQIQTIATIASKEAKREAKKAQFIRQVQETSKVREVIIVQDILRQLKNERIRNDFLQGSNGACLIDDDEMNVLEQFSKFTVPIHPNFSNESSFVNSAKSAADHLSFLIDGRTRQFMESGFNYEKIKELFYRIQTCGYWEKDMKIVEAPSAETIIMSTTQERPAESETPQSSDDLESKEDKIEETMSKGKGNSSLPPAPLPTQVPNPLFNGNLGMIPPQAPMHMMAPHPQQQQQQPSQAQQQLQMKPVTAVENAFFNQMKYSQGPMIGAAAVKGPADNNLPPNRFIEDFSTSSISFLQDSLVEQQQQQQQKMPTNFVSQPKPSPVQSQQQQPPPLAQPHQAISTFHHQQPPSQTHFPPGLKVAAASNIPVSFTQQASQQTQQAPPSHLVQPQQQAYPPQPPQQYQQKMPTNIPNLQDIEQKTNAAHPQQQQPSSHEISDRTAQRNDLNEVSKEKSRNSNEWNAGNNQQQPQIDTWTNETSMGNNQSGNGNYSRYHRGDRGGGRGTGASGNGGVERGSKFNNYR